MSICSECGREFTETKVRRGYPRKYCSKACYRAANRKQCLKRRRLEIDNERREWAYKEARYLNHIAYEVGVDELADYVYNNYNKRSQTK